MVTEISKEIKETMDVTCYNCYYNPNLQQEPKIWLKILFLTDINENYTNPACNRTFQFNLNENETLIEISLRIFKRIEKRKQSVLEKQRTEFTKDGLRDPIRFRWMHIYYQIRVWNP